MPKRTVPDAPKAANKGARYMERSDMTPKGRGLADTLMQDPYNKVLRKGYVKPEARRLSKMEEAEVMYGWFPGVWDKVFAHTLPGPLPLRNLPLKK
jgi:hypothetical protein